MKKIILLIQILFAIANAGCKQNASNADAQSPETPSTSERIKQNCKVFNSINGRHIFSINKDSDVESIPTSDPSWLKIAINVKLNHKEFMQKNIAENSVLQDETGKEIGIATEKINVMNAESEDNNLTGYIIGYIPKTDLDINTTIETKIQNICNAKETKTIDDFSKIIYDYEFTGFRYDSLMDKLDMNKEEYGAIKNITEYTLEDSWLADPSLDRISLIFLNDTLISIVNRRSMNFPDATRMNMPNNRTLIIFKNNQQIIEQLPLFKQQVYQIF